MIERVTGQGYEEFMMNILKCVGINQMKIGRTQKKELSPEEVRGHSIFFPSLKHKGKQLTRTTTTTFADCSVYFLYSKVPKVINQRAKAAESNKKLKLLSVTTE